MNEQCLISLALFINVVYGVVGMFIFGLISYSYYET